ncbi:hypothetical protein [Brachybacterium hainanense]|uniref:Uncharacterized protein n=1 Tax=Brachybacterium hainanense TaxID=1541174 RepID=A0ABV6R969_9MICO
MSAGIPTRAATGAPFLEDGDLVELDLCIVTQAVVHAAGDVGRGRAGGALAQLRNARAALDRAERILARYAEEDR